MLIFIYKSSLIILIIFSCRSRSVWRNRDINEDYEVGKLQLTRLRSAARRDVSCSAVKRSIGSTIGFHNHGEGPY